VAGGVDDERDAGRSRPSEKRNFLSIMAKLRLLFTLSYLALAIGFVSAQEKISGEILPANFENDAFKHIEFLASLGHRQVGSENDAKTIDYIKKQFLQYGLSVEVQPFQFESFEYSSVDLLIDGNKYDVSGLGFNPYKSEMQFNCKAALIDFSDPNESKYNNLQDKVIITNDRSAHFKLMMYKPKMIVYLIPEEFDKINSQGEADAQIQIYGEMKKYKSANVVAQVGNQSPSAKEILVTAHFDTYRQNNPGASDNASGVAVMLELAKYFKRIENELPCIIKFVAFGAEEIGTVGSRNYLYNNEVLMQKCELLFNIDDVGGHRKILVEKEGGVRGIPEQKASFQIPDYLKTSAWEGVNSIWRILPDDELLKIFGASNHPDLRWTPLSGQLRGLLKVH
jgi:hypothetical protein